MSSPANRTSVVVAVIAATLSVLASTAVAQDGGGGGQGSASISGHVTDETPGVAMDLEGVCATAYDLATFTEAGTATTAGDGTYEITGLVAGDYFVSFNVCDQPLDGYASEWWEETPSFNEATVVTLGEGQTAQDIDATLPEAGTISGTITDDPGNGLEGICITALEEETFVFGEAETAGDGSYDITNLRGGDYQVFFQDCSDPATFITEIYDDIQYRGNNDQSSQQQPQTVTVTAGQDTTGIDATLEEGGSITGTVTAVHTEREVPFVCLGAWHPATSGETPDFVSVTGIDISTFSGVGFPDSSSQDVDGQYTFPGLPVGDYQVEFNSSVCIDDGYAIEWHEDTPERSGATTITIEQGDVVDGVDAVLQPLPSISAVCFQSSVDVGPGGEQQEQQSQFDDVSSDNVHQRAIDCAADYGIAEGDQQGNYNPGDRVNRGQMASFVARTIAGLGVQLPSNPPDAFDDDDGTTHELAINQLAELGVVSGQGDGDYGPGDPVARGAMATFLVNAYETATDFTLRSTGNRFGDDDGATHEASINKAATAGFAAGVSESAYEPGKVVRRDQMASFLMRTYDRAVRDGLFFRAGSPASGSGSTSSSGSSTAPRMDAFGLDR